MRRLRRRYSHARGTLSCPAGSEIQALLFPTSRFNVASAKAWAHKHGRKTGDVDIKPDYIHLRQEDPSGFSRVRTVHLGARGVLGRVGWRKC